jgi:lactoylglutathione lyase
LSEYGAELRLDRISDVTESLAMDPKLPIRSLDYTVIFARHMSVMRKFYGTVRGFPLHRELSSRWIEYRIGSNILALTERGAMFDDPPPPVAFGNRTLFFRDPDGNILEIYAEI